MISPLAPFSAALLIPRSVPLLVFWLGGVRAYTYTTLCLAMIPGSSILCGAGSRDEGFADACNGLLCYSLRVVTCRDFNGVRPGVQRLLQLSSISTGGDVSTFPSSLSFAREWRLWVAGWRAGRQPCAFGTCFFLSSRFIIHCPLRYRERPFGRWREVRCWSRHMPMGMGSIALGAGALSFLASFGRLDHLDGLGRDGRWHLIPAIGNYD